MRKSMWLALGLCAMLLSGFVGPSTLSAKENTVLKIVNGLGRWDIHFVNVSPASSSSWGEDQLDSDQILRPGESESWSLDPGSYDLRVRDEDGDVYIRYDVCIPSSMTVEWRVTLDDLQSD